MASDRSLPCLPPLLPALVLHDPMTTASLLLVLPLLAAVPDSAKLANSPDSVRVEREPVEPSRDYSAADMLRGEGLENVVVILDSTARLSATYENRRYIHGATALGHAANATGVPASFTPLRLGLPIASLPLTPGSWPPEVTYPSDPGWIRPLAGPRLDPTRWNVDLILRPLFDYEIGRLYDPVMVRTSLRPELSTQPWTGARALVSWVFPLRTDFAVTELAPDVNRSRPGPATLEQFGWLGRVGLGSATVGLFGLNRWGVSLGLARPFAGGAFLIDGRLDETGFWAWSDSGITYSDLSQTSGYLGVTYRPPLWDLAIRVRAAKYLYNDQGIEVELERSLGDFDLAFFAQHTDGTNVTGARIGIPIPPLTRPTWPVRVLPPDRIALNYRDAAAPLGIQVSDVASREEFLEHHSEPSLAANRRRFGVATGDTPPPQPTRAEPVSWVGMTGFVTTPWAGVQPDQNVELGYAKVPKAAAWDYRGEHANEVYYVSLGFLPRTELGLRWTVLPGLKSFENEVPDSKLTDSDRMLSGRVAIFEPGTLRPGLAVGIEDALGTRRFHSTYAVTGTEIPLKALQGRLTLGYAFPVFEAKRHQLDGAFGAAELSYSRFVTTALEYDSERWNAAVALHPGLGFHLRAALFDLRYLGLSAGWSRAL